MTTFGEFFDKLRSRSEQTGRADAACRAMDLYQSRCRIGDEVPFRTIGWEAIAPQELSHATLLEFSAVMAHAGVARLVEKMNSDVFDPGMFSSTLDSVHEFHHAMLEVAHECGLDVRNLSDWRNVRQE